ncbi:MAG: hypothetical protein Q9164_001591 [Protoblastenia rupestris]
MIWTDTQQDRLLAVQAELKKAQKRWSASQEQWLEEEHHLLELKRLHKKALKKEEVVAKKAAGIWKSKTWGSRIPSLRSSRKTSVANIHDFSAEQNDDDDTEDEDADSDAEGQELEQVSTQSTLSGAIRRLSFSVRSRRNTGTPSDVSRAVSRSRSPRR